MNETHNSSLASQTRRNRRSEPRDLKDISECSQAHAVNGIRKVLQSSAELCGIYKWGYWRLAPAGRASTVPGRTRHEIPVRTPILLGPTVIDVDVLVTCILPEEHTRFSLCNQT